MYKKDKLGSELKSIMEEEAFDLILSQTVIENILKIKKNNISHKIKEFLNREIEISLTPAIIGLVVLIAVTIFPKDIFNMHDERIIDINGSQVIIREMYEVSKK